MRENIRKGLLYFEWVSAGTLLIALTTAVFLQVFSRYLFHLSLSWPEELARFCFVWASLMGASIAAEKKKLHDIDLGYNLLPDSVKPFVSLAAHLMVCMLLIVLLVYGIELTQLVHTQESPAMEIRMSYVYSAIPVCASLMLISYLFETWDRFFELPFFSDGGART